MSLVVFPARILNDQRGIFGLWMSDFASAVGIFILITWLLEGSGLELIGLPIAFLTLFILSPIRLITRRKIIRDFVTYLLRRKELYDPSLERIS